MGKNVIGIVKECSIHARISKVLHDDIMRECSEKGINKTDVIIKRLMRGAK